MNWEAAAQSVKAVQLRGDIPDEVRKAIKRLLKDGGEAPSIMAGLSVGPLSQSALVGSGCTGLLAARGSMWWHAVSRATTQAAGACLSQCSWTTHHLASCLQSAGSPLSETASIVSAEKTIADRQVAQVGIPVPERPVALSAAHASPRPCDLSSAPAALRHADDAC